MRSVLALIIALAGCDNAADDRTTAILDLEGDPGAGQVVYTDNCAVCHLESGRGSAEGGAGSDLSEVAGESDEDAEIVDSILDGVETMPAFADTLSDQDIADVVAYIHDGLF